MKTKRNYIAVLLSIIIFISLFDGKTIYTQAVSQFTLSTVTISGTDYQCYENTDQNMPSGFQFFWATNGRVYHADSGNFLMLILNKRFGLTVSTNWFTSFLSYFTTEAMGAGQRVESFFTGSVYRVSNGVGVCGVALNDLSGLPLADAMTNATNTDLVVPDQVVDSTKNIIDDYLVDNPITPAFINLECRNKASFLANINTYSSYYQNMLDIINNPDSNVLFSCGGTSATGSWAFVGSADGFPIKQNYYAFNNATDYCYVATFNFDSICNDFNLSIENFTITQNDVLTSTSSTTLRGTVKNPATMQDINSTLKNVANLSTSTADYLTFLNGNYNVIPFSDSVDYITIYKNNNTVVNITNNQYKQEIYTSNDWRSYNTSNDNSITTNSNTVNNSITNNTSIYDNSTSETNTNIKENNYTYNTNQIDNSVTTIINNYYPSDDQGGGGGDDNNDDDDDSIWKALLKAIAGFFEKIGELIATLLTGIFSIFTSILDAITSITEDFTSITSFISSFFSWLPAPITSLIVLGLGLALICAFLTWFKK